MTTNFFKSGDKILIVGLIVIAACLMAWYGRGTNPHQHLTAVITHDGKLVKRIDLSNLNKPENIELDEEGIPQTIRAEKGRIRFLASDCPHKTCVKTGWLRRPGAKAVCIPSKVVISIVGDNKPVDILAY